MNKQICICANSMYPRLFYVVLVLWRWNYTYGRLNTFGCARIRNCCGTCPIVRCNKNKFFYIVVNFSNIFFYLVSVLIFTRLHHHSAWFYTIITRLMYCLCRNWHSLQEWHITQDFRYTCTFSHFLFITLWLALWSSVCPLSHLRLLEKQDKQYTAGSGIAMESVLLYLDSIWIYEFV